MKNFKIANLILLLVMAAAIAQAQELGKYATVNGIEMYYEVQGTGQPLVLIHGGGSTITTTFGKIMPLLAASHKVIAVELQAHGHTADRSAPETFEQDADDVATLLTQLGISGADVFGFSNGGNTAMQIAIRHPEKVHKLIIASAFYKKEGMYPWFWKMMDTATFGGMPQLYKDAYLKINNSAPGLLNMYNKDVSRMRTFKDWKDEDLKAIKAPALIVVGDEDVVKPEHAVAMYRLLPLSRLAILPGTHGAYMGEAMMPNPDSKTPALFVALVEEFLAAP